MPNPKIQKDYVVPYILHLSLGNLIFQNGKLKDRELALKELAGLSENYKREKVNIKGLDLLISDLKNKNIEITVKADPVAKECIGRTRMVV